MATLVNLCLQNRIDLPFYRLHQEEVRLFVCAGKLLDEKMERLFLSFDAYLERKMNGSALSENQKLVLSYLMKSEWANEQLRHTILLTPDNNHFDELVTLEQQGLIHKHVDSSPLYPIYAVDRELMKHGYSIELQKMFGVTFNAMDELSKMILGLVYRFNRFSKIKIVSAKQVSFFLWAQDGGKEDDIKGFDAFYRKVRYLFNKLEKAEFVTKKKGSRGYLLNDTYRQTHLG